MTKRVVLEAKALSKRYPGLENPVICNFDLVLNSGEVVAVTGPSGCGKTTLLQVLGLLTQSDSGSLLINGQSMSDRSEAEMTMARRLHYGFVYQSYNLLGDLTAVQNAALPLILRGVGKKLAESEAADLLCNLGLDQRLHHLPYQMSGGEQQRVGIARSLIHKPTVVLADEPTGNLDESSANAAMNLLVAMAKDVGSAVVIVTHNAKIAAMADRCIALK